MNSPHWKNITFQVRLFFFLLLVLSKDLNEKRLLKIFDIPSMGDKPFEERIEFLKKMFGKGGSHASMYRIKVVEQQEVRDRDHVLERLKEIEELGGEGLMLRKPGS
jgi:DNA ligase 1